MIRHEDQRLLQPFLLPGERLLWTGRPRRGLILGSRDLLLVPLSLAFEALPLWAFSTWKEDDPILAAMAVLAAVVGLYPLIGRFLHDARLRARLLYAVSNRRVILLETGRSPRLRALEIGHLPMLVLDQQRGDRGTLRFAVDEGNESFVGHDSRLWAPPSDRLSFEQIEHPQRVYDLIARETDRRRRELFGAAVDDPLFLG